MGALKLKLGPWLLLLLFVVIFVELLLMSPGALNKKSDETDSAQKVTESQNETKEIPNTEINSDISQTMQGVHVVETKSDRREWELWSDVASTYKQTGNLALQTVKTKFFGKDETYFIVNGDSGSVVSQTKDMFIEGKVETKSSNGYRFSTSQIKYDSQSRHLISDSEVKIVGPSSEKDSRLFLQGAQLRADLQSSEIFVDGDVRARKGVEINGLQQVNIRANQAKLSSQTNEVSFSGDVFINIQGMRISGPSARFQYKPDSGQIAAIELDGGVKVSDYDKWATSEKVRIDLDKNLYIFKGAPKVVQENDELFGDEIIFQDGGKKVKVKNARVKVSGQHLGTD